MSEADRQLSHCIYSRWYGDEPYGAGIRRVVVFNRHGHFFVGEQSSMAPQNVHFCPLRGLVKATFSEGGFFTKTNSKKNERFIIKM